MKTLRINPSSIVTACVAFGLATIGHAADDGSSTIKFSDPAKPGTVKISLGRGELTIQGADSSDVVVKSDAKPVTSKRKDGLRVISAASSFALSEKNNVVTIDSATHDFGRGNGNFRLTVPRNTNVIVQNAWGGDIRCNNLSGDIEINTTHGEIRLDEVSGGVVVGTMHGEIRANIRELHEGKPVSFTTMNGEVHVRVPETAKANVRLRTQNGSVLTDFEESALVTKTETSMGMPRGKNTVWMKPGGKVLTAEVEEAIREATRLSATAVKEAMEAVKEGLDASRIESDEARKQLEEARRDIEKARREVERERRVVAAERAGRAGGSTPATPAVPAAPEMPAPGAMPKPPAVPKIATIPTITGGKLVTGTLNGGGPEISVSTMNGDVVLRKLEKK
jgi:DUF4097 and DUF4098 domain-containing protein YvlB